MPLCFRCCRVSASLPSTLDMHDPEIDHSAVEMHCCRARGYHSMAIDLCYRPSLSSTLRRHRPCLSSTPTIVDCYDHRPESSSLHTTSTYALKGASFQGASTAAAPWQKPQPAEANHIITPVHNTSIYYLVHGTAPDVMEYTPPSTLARFA